MHNSILKKVFTPLVLQEESHSNFFNSWEEVHFSKGDFITESNTVERYFYVVLEGVQTIYILTPEGDKKVIGFSYAGSFSGVYDSFLNEKASHYFLEALTTTSLLRINKESYNAFFDEYPEFNYWGRIAHQELLIGRVNREIELITLTAKERFDAFMNRCPEELKTIPQKYLASYLNMTPETFSRLRAMIS
jgi:CRP-like cAMP-binding protein